MNQKPSEPRAGSETGEHPGDLERTISVAGPKPPGKDTRSLPAEIGGYRILGLLGQGGMGVVYEAEQPSPRRNVALKVVRGAELVDDLRLKMFEREAATLARLDHPNIGRIYESGRTEEGRHFFAMELVRGPDLATWLAGRPSSPDRAEIELRLRLFRQICDAVHYAHQRGVIHRDLKPSNLIVTDAVASGTGSGVTPSAMVKVLDFGLARMTEEDVAVTQVTEVGVIKGTLPYMAPEQARGDAGAIDVRTDVYALGVILYELLTCRRPYSVDTGSLFSALAVICDQPPRPLAENWNATARLDPDLATIVATALHKEPDRRYASAAAFSEDLGRLLTSQPIQARPASTLYQIRKLVERRKPLFATAAAALVLVVAAAVGMAFLYVRSEADRARAVDAEQSARREAKTAQRTSDFLVELFHRANPERTRGETVTAREVMDEGARGVENELGGEPLVQARLMLTIGQVYRSLGSFGQARDLTERAVALYRLHLPPGSPESASAVHQRALVLEDLGKQTESKAAFQESVRMFERLGPAGEEGLTTALGDFSEMLREAGDYSAADSAVARAIALADSRHPPDEDHIIKLYANQAKIREDVHQVDSALAILNRALALSRKVHGDRDNNTAAVLHNLGVAQAMAGHLDEATRNTTEALSIDRAIYGDSHPVVARDLGEIGIFLAQQGKKAEARKYFQETLDAQIRIYGPDHPAVAKSWMNLGFVTLELGDPRGAVVDLERSVALYEKAGESSGPGIAFSLSHLADAREALGQFDVAGRLIRRVVAVDEKNMGPASSDVADDLETLAAIERKLGHASEADGLEARMRAIRAKLKAQPGSK